MSGRPAFTFISSSDRYRVAAGGPAQRSLAALIPTIARGISAWIAADAPMVTPPGLIGLRIDVPGRELADHRDGYCAATLGPLYHGRAEPPVFHRGWQRTYERVNQRYAQRIAAIAAPHATVLVHDIALQRVPAHLRQLRPDLRIGCVLRQPFPPPELVAQLPAAAWVRPIDTVRVRAAATALATLGRQP